jgi:hypothetical protein
LEIVKRLVSELPTGSHLSFYDAQFSSPSDPGIYVVAERCETGYVVTGGNHGWSTESRKIDFEALASLIWAARACNMGGAGGISIKAEWGGLSFSSGWPSLVRRVDDEGNTPFGSYIKSRSVGELSQGDNDTVGNAG